MRVGLRQNNLEKLLGDIMRINLKYRVRHNWQASRLANTLVQGGPKRFFL